MADLNDLIHWRNRERVERHHTDRVGLDDETRQLIADLRERIAALEGHATAQLELSEALRAVLMLMRDMGARTTKLETEAVETHRTVATVLPVLAAARG